MFRSDCFSDVSDDEASDYTPLELAGGDVYRSIGGCAVASRPTQHSFEPLNTFQDSFRQPTSKAKALDQGLDYYGDDRLSNELCDLTNHWQFPQAAQTQPEPKQEPAWVFPQSSLMAEENATTLFADIQSILGEDRSGISFETFPDKFKIKAVSFGPDGQTPLPTHFRVRVYARSVSRVVVEFRRSAGCVRVFMGVFRQVAARLGARVCMLSGEEFGLELPTAPAPKHVLSLPSPKTAPAALAVSAWLGTLLLLIRGEYLDQQKQAFAELVALSLQHRAALLPHRQELMALALQQLRSPDEEMVRCAAVVLSNLNVAAPPVAEPHEASEETPWAPVEVEAALAQMLGVLQHPPTLLNADTKRHTARAMLAALGGPGGELMDTVAQSRFRCAADDTLRRDMLDTRQLVF